MDILIGVVIAAFIIAGVYVGYHYSQDPGNFESHSMVPVPAHAQEQRMAYGDAVNTMHAVQETRMAHSA